MTSTAKDRFLIQYCKYAAQIGFLKILRYQFKLRSKFKDFSTTTHRKDGKEYLATTKTDETQINRSDFKLTETKTINSKLIEICNSPPICYQRSKKQVFEEVSALEFGERNI